MKRFFYLPTLLLLAFFAMYTGWVHAKENTIEVTNASINKVENTYKLSANFSFDLNRSLENALHNGIPLFFTMEANVVRSRWYWFDEKTISLKKTVRISYNVLTKEYNVSTLGSLQQNFSTLEDALFMIRKPPRWTIAQEDQLTSDTTYSAAVRVLLDTSQLPKPLQIHMINNPDWRLSSDWKRFTFKA